LRISQSRIPGLEKRSGIGNLIKNQIVTTHLTPPTLLEICFIFHEQLTFSDQSTSLFKARYYNICQLHCIWPYLDLSTACIVATSTVHSKLDYCNSLYYRLSQSQLSRLQQTQNSLARTVVVKAPKSCHITLISSYAFSPGSKSLNASNTSSSLTYKVLTTTQPPYLHIIVLVVVALHVLLLFLGHQHHPL